jgi:hypothetical protein
MMPATPNRAMLSRLVDDYDQIAEESLGSGDPEFHEIEDRLYEAIVDLSRNSFPVSMFVSDERIACSDHPSMKRSAERAA